MEVRQEQLERIKGDWFWSYRELYALAWPPLEAYAAKMALARAIENWLTVQDNVEVLSDWYKTSDCKMTFKEFADKWLPYIKAEGK